MKNKKNIIFYSVLVVLLILSVVIYQITTKAAGNDGDSDKTTVATANIASIKTGSGNFDTSEGVGNDTTQDDRIVRSFDSITYKIQASIKNKDGQTVYSTRNVDVTISISDQEAGFISFDKSGVTGQTSKTYTISNLSAGGSVGQVEIPVYIKNADNDYQFAPTFSIKESTDSSDAVTIGKVSDEIRYSYNGQYQSYSSFENNATNNMPTVITSSSGKASLNATLISGGSGQNTSEGRYFTGVVELSTSNTPGGHYENSVSYPFTIQPSDNSVETNDSWVRLYDSSKIDEINPVVVNTAYSTGENKTGANETRNPGNVSLSGGQLTISDFKIPNMGPTVAADNSSISDRKVIGTYAITAYRKRTEADGTNPITLSMALDNGTPITFSGDYNSTQDYGLQSGFYDASGDSRLTQKVDYGIPERIDINSSTSKGSTIVYKTNFNYKQTGSQTGLKEVIKVDDNAFRVYPYADDKDVGISITCGNNKCEGIDEDSFEVKFISGSWDPSNYEVTTIDSRVSGDFSSQCSSLSASNNDQMMNICGGPCIKAKEGVEQSFDRIKDAKNDKNKEIPITKVIVQTKEGVKLPNEANITVYTKLRVRNIGDLTRTYQATSVASTSDYDSVLRYYSPELLADVGASTNILNPDNYTRSNIIGDRVIPTANMDQPYGDSIRIVNFTARQDISVLNTQSDGQTKTSFSVDENETIEFRVRSYIEDMNERVGADDTWFIKDAAINITIDPNLDYIPDDSLGTPAVTQGIDGKTTLTYIVPWSKPNQNIKDIRFNVKLKSTITGTSVPMLIESTLDPININGEQDYSEVEAKKASYTIYGTYSPTVLLSQESTGNTIVDKNQEFSYVLKAYNNTGETVVDYSILDILPYNNDDRKSNFDGSYEVKVDLPDSEYGAKVYCSTMDPKTLSGDVDNSKDTFTECSASEYNKATAIKITGLRIEKDQNMDPIAVTIKPTDNKFGNKYVNDFKGAYKKLTPKKSNKITYKVISRTVSGRVFYDSDEDGIRQDDEKLVGGIPVTLYKLSNEGLQNSGETTTNEKGEYAFTNLEAGYYKVRLKLDGKKFDLTRRYATLDPTRDSDAYKINDNEAEISNRYNPNEIDGINLSVFEDNIKADMDMGLIPRESFGFEVKKYITQVDLNYNNSLTTNKYENKSEVALNVRNTLSSNAKVYYGIQVTNNSTRSGYVKLLEETIPNGMIYNSDDPYNADWHIVEGNIQSNKYQDTVVKPGESIYLQIAMEMPNRSEAGTFINRVTLLNVEQYDPDLGEEAYQYNAKGYSIGEQVEYANETWRVLSVGNIVPLDQALVELNYTEEEYNSTEDIKREVDSYINNNQELTLITENSYGPKPHMNSGSGIYKWSESKIKEYINGEWAKQETSLNVSALKDQVVCDDSSGLDDESYGGTLFEEGTCISNIYTTSKIRLLNKKDIENIMSTQPSNPSWLLGSGNTWLMNTAKNKNLFDYYGNETTETQNNNRKAMYMNSNSATNYVGQESASTSYAVRPVITVSGKHIITN